MAKISSIYGSPWLRADDLQGRSLRATIARAGEDSIRQADGTYQQRVVVDFEGKAKRLILNKTQASALVAIAGDNTDDWRGVSVTLQPVPSFGGKMTIAILADSEKTPF